MQKIIIFHLIPKSVLVGSKSTFKETFSVIPDWTSHFLQDAY